MILDCETATLPFVKDYEDGKAKKKIAIAKPLIYDLGYTIADKTGKIYVRKNFLISEIFSVPEIFDTAYYASKRPLYVEKLRKGEIKITGWQTAIKEFEEDLQLVVAVGAYNSMFDFKKAIPFTDLYINKLYYSCDFQKWLSSQKRKCDYLLAHDAQSEKEFEPEIFRFHGKEYPLFDLWGLSCNHLLNNKEYKAACIENKWQTESGKYFKTSAETTYRFLKKQTNFDESHTAIDDAEIETEIFAAIVKKAKKVECGIMFFPFRLLGLVTDFITE